LRIRGSATLNHREEMQEHHVQDVARPEILGLRRPIDPNDRV
jgi:hypothetical protein